MEIIAILKFKLHLLLNNRIKELPKLNEALSLRKVDDDYEIFFAQTSIFRDLLDKRDSIDAYNFLLEEKKMTYDVSDLVLEFVSTVVRSLFLSQTENQYYENNLLKTFFLMQILDKNEKYYEYNLKNFLRYSYASSELYKNISVSNEGVFLKDNESGELYVINETIKKLIYIICPQEYAKDIEEIFSFILMEREKVEIANMLNDKLAEYISFENFIKIENDKKLCKILLRCIEANQESENILVSKFLLNTFLHYFFSENTHFIEKNKKYIVKKSEDNKILKKIYYILFNLNQVKISIWNKLENENIFENNEDFFYRYNIINGIKSEKKFSKKYCGKI